MAPGCFKPREDPAKIDDRSTNSIEFGDDDAIRVTAANVIQGFDQARSLSSPAANSSLDNNPNKVPAAAVTFVSYCQFLSFETKAGFSLILCADAHKADHFVAILHGMSVCIRTVAYKT